MNLNAASSVISPRPKVHRLPGHLLRPAKKPSAAGLIFLKSGTMLAVIFMVFIGLSQIIPQLSATQGSVAQTLQVSASIPVAEVMVATLRPEKSKDGTIVIVGQSGSIIGRLAKIPAQNEQITEIKPVSEVDNKAGRELLSIINKY
jgi:hypothetical protein